MTNIKLRAALLSTIGVLASPVLAQQATVAPAAGGQGHSIQDQAGESGSALSGDVIVTAQRREQNVQKVGIAITAFSGAQLRELNVTDSR